MQSALEPGGEAAARIAALGGWMFAGAAVIFTLVLVLTVLAIRRRPAWLAHRHTIVIGGIALPVVVLTALLVYGLGVAAALDRGRLGRPALRIEVTGEQFWWRVHYLDDSGRVALATANEIHLPAGRTVELTLRTRDVIHSFWAPSLAGKLDMIPGRANILRLRAARPGVHRGQCAEYCGAQHALMAFHVVAQEPWEFAAWLARQQRPTAASAAPELARGRELFLASKCVECHTIRGTPADGRRGPDLTHVGSRLTIAAGTLPNNAGTLAGWIASSQHLKAGNPMPSFTRFAGRDLRAIAEYLESLK